MPTYKKGNYWDSFAEADLFCFTSNGKVTNDGRLVMGAGTAKQVRDRFVGIDKLFSEKAKIYHSPRPNIHLYFLIIVEWEGKHIGALQTKLDWKDPSSLDLINQSIITLAQRNETNIHIPYPGIGYGGLKKEQVAPLLEKLPDTVTIWEY